MSWRGAVFLGGASLGALAAFAALDAFAERLPVALDSPLVLLAAAVAFGAVSVWGAARSAARAIDPEARGGGLALATTSGFAALPCLASVRLGLWPPAGWLFSACALAMIVSLALAPMVRATSARWLARSLGWMLVGSAAVAMLAGAFVHSGAGPTPFDARRGSAILDLDAEVATVALPGCAQRVDDFRVRTDRGAHPRLGPDGALWFDAFAPDDDGPLRRQLHRLRPGGGGPECMTCGQPGNNQRPAVAANGRSVVFDSDREATWRTPLDTELFRMDLRDGRVRTTRRLTYSIGPDEQAVLARNGRIVVWSRGARGRRALVSSTIVTGHGGLMLSSPGLLRAAAGSGIAAVGWSPDARTLALVEGNPLAPLRVVGLDLATGEQRLLGRAAPADATLGANADGGWLGVVGGAASTSLGHLPAGAAHLLDAFPRSVADGGRTRLATGPAAGPWVDVALPEEIAGWGEPSGVALSADGRTAFVAQRRSGDSSDDERIVELFLGCVGDGSP